MPADRTQEAIPDLHEKLVLCADRFGHTLTERNLGHLIGWIELLVAWNQRIDLTAARSADELVDLAVADALVAIGTIPIGARVVDVGTGAGAPGLAVALIRPDVDTTLVESSAKRIAFLRTVTGSLGVCVKLVRDRAERIVGMSRWDFAISRATFEPSAWLRLGLSLVEPADGRVLVLLAREEPPAMDGALNLQRIDYTWPLTQARRTLCVYAARAPQHAETRD